jgi:hypothetical protein
MYLNTGVQDNIAKQLVETAHTDQNLALYLLGGCQGRGTSPATWQTK